MAAEQSRGRWSICDLRWRGTGRGATFVSAAETASGSREIAPVRARDEAVEAKLVKSDGQGLEWVGREERGMGERGGGGGDGSSDGSDDAEDRGPAASPGQAYRVRGVVLRA